MTIDDRDLTAKAPDHTLVIPETAQRPRIVVRAWGDGEPACVFLHGFGEGAFIWDGIASDVSPSGRALAPDLRGHGNSGWDPMGRYGLRDYCGDLEVVLRDLGLMQYLIIGHSMGGRIALELAAHRPEGLLGLAMVDVGLDHNAPGRRQVFADFARSQRPYANPEEYLEWLLQTRPMAVPSRLEHQARQALKLGPAGRYELRRDPAMLMAQPLAEKNPWDLLQDVTAPLLVVRGAGSAILSADIARQMVCVARNATLETIPLAGHAIMADNPAHLAKVLSGFVNETKNSLAVTPSRSN